MINARKYIFKSYVLLLFASVFFFSQNGYAQPGYKKFFKVKENIMYIILSKNLPITSLDSFILAYNLRDIGLYTLVKTGKSDSIERSGWKLQLNTDDYTLTKKIESGTDLKKSGDRMIFSAIPTPDDWREVGGNRVIYGVNQFKGGQTFRYENNITYFFLKGHTNARSVRLAGNFTNWQHGAFPMVKTAAGWIAGVQLTPGQYFYKFIINRDDWITDPDNHLKENDGRGNINSVYFVPNKIFFLRGYQNATTVFLSGSFNNWSKHDLPMKKTTGGWQLPVYLEKGTHQYYYIVDGKIVKEPGPETNDGKVILGKPHSFLLKGFTTAGTVSLAGNFNNWKPGEILMERSADGWKVSYVLGPGNYQYKFIVDGNWITDPANPNIIDDGMGNLNSFMVVEPNYTFRLSGYPNAKKVNLSGEFNNWSPQGLVMSRSGNEWVGSVYLGRGKHLYKFIVDGQWIRDPKNPLWEDGSENSVLWIE